MRNFMKGIHPIILYLSLDSYDNDKPYVVSRFPQATRGPPNKQREIKLDIACLVSLYFYKAKCENEFN